MSLPGLGLLPGLGGANFGGQSGAPQRNQQDTAFRLQTLAANTEWRFEVPFDREIKLKLISGEAEYFGAEFASDREYIFTGARGAVYTYNGCKLEIEGGTENDYVGEETEMTMLYNAHFALEEQRSVAQASGKLGPRVLVVGPSDTGKTSVVRVLTNYAVKSGRLPTVINLDPAEGVLSLPGAFTATTFADTLEIEEPGGWGNSAVTGPSPAIAKSPLVYHFGCKAAEENKLLYNALVTRLALAVTSRLEGEQDANAKSSGFFIDTSGSIGTGRDSYESIKHIVSEFSINAIIVLGSEKLFQDMTRIFATASNGEETIAVAKIPKAEGCVSRDETYMRELSKAQIHHYFFGSATSIQLSPYIQWVEFGGLTLYQILDLAQKRNAEFNPGDADEHEPKVSIYKKITPSTALQDQVVAITSAAANDSLDALRDATVVAYIYVAEVDEAASRMRILTTLSGRIPSNALVMGGWPEAVPGLT